MCVMGVDHPVHDRVLQSIEPVTEVPVGGRPNKFTSHLTNKIEMDAANSHLRKGKQEGHIC